MALDFYQRMDALFRPFLKCTPSHKLAVCVNIHNGIGEVVLLTDHYWRAAMWLDLLGETGFVWSLYTRDIVLPPPVAGEYKPVTPVHRKPVVIFEHRARPYDLCDDLPRYRGEITLDWSWDKPIEYPVSDSDHWLLERAANQQAAQLRANQPRVTPFDRRNPDTTGPRKVSIGEQNRVEREILYERKMRLLGMWDEGEGE